LDSRFGFTPSEAHQILRDMGPKGREIYKGLNTVDFIVAPIVFRSYFLNTLPATSPQREAIREFVMNVYFIGDLSENICVAALLRMYPRTPEVVAWIGCAANVMKFLGLFAGAACQLFEGYARLRAAKAKAQ
jgi:hypothetical protein